MATACHPPSPGAYATAGCVAGAENCVPEA